MKYQTKIIFTILLGLLLNPGGAWADPPRPEEATVPMRPLVGDQNPGLGEQAISVTPISTSIGRLAFVPKNEGSVSLGYRRTGGNTDTANLSFNFDFSYEREKYRLFLDGKSAYSETNGIKSDDENEVDLRAELRIDRLFPFWNVNYLKSPFKGYDNRLSTGPGCGYYFIKTEQTYLTASAYVLYNRDTFIQSDKEGNIEEKHFMNYLETRFRHKFNDSIKFKEKFILKVSSKSDQDYYLYYEGSVENSLTENFGLEFKIIADYANIPPSEGVKMLDSKFITAVKYSF